MRLRSKTTLYFLLMMALLLLLGGWQIFSGVQQVVRAETDEALWRDWMLVKPLLEHSEDPRKVQIPNLCLRKFKNPFPPERMAFRDTLLPEIPAYGQAHSTGTAAEHGREPYRVMTLYAEIHGDIYQIEVLSAQVDDQELVATILGIVLWVLAGLVLAVLVFQFVIAEFLWRPFRHILREVHAFDLSGLARVDFGRSSTREFRQLIAFLERMTAKVRSDYHNLKTFSENASHELQTPLAIIRTKLERLLQSDRLAASEVDLVATALQVLHRLHRLNDNLLLLGKVENEQFVAHSAVPIGPAMEDVLAQQRELFALKNIAVHVRFGDSATVWTDPTLLEMVLRNLLSNALRHNVEGGKLYAWQSGHCIEIGNTGRREALDRQLIFQRFGKQSTHPRSSGLGLAIVRKICDTQGWQISYLFEDELHVFRLEMSGGKAVKGKFEQQDYKTNSINRRPLRSQFPTGSISN